MRPRNWSIWKKWKQLELFGTIKLEWVIQGCAIILAVAYLFYDNWWISVLFSPYLLVFFRAKRKDRIEQQRNQLKMQFKDAMQAVSFALNVGCSMENAFKEAIKELLFIYEETAPIIVSFRKIVRKVENNEPIEVCLMEFANESAVEDIVYFAEVFQYAKRSGGDLIAIIRNTAATIRDKVELEQEIQTIISGKKMEQKIMTLMPFAMLLYLRLTSSQMLSPMYGNLLGIVIMTVCLGIYLVAVYISKRIIKIEV